MLVTACAPHVTYWNSVELKGAYASREPKIHNAHASCPQIQVQYGVSLRRSPTHTGIDIGGDIGDPVIAAAPGKVVWSGTQPEGGNIVVIYHGLDEFENHVFSNYGHNEKNLVAVNKPVARGQKIARLGKTGMWSGGIEHLHFEATITPDGTIGTRKDGIYYLKDQKRVNLNTFVIEASDGFDAIAPYNPSANYRDLPGKFSGFTYPVPCG
jgi:murein DD-endopeptidase MepM/ murein hydrolase activator NlpD